MDINVTRQAVCINEVIFDQSAEQAIDTDFSLPDYCPDIVRLLKCRIMPRLASKNLAGDTLTVDGAAVATLIYADENNKIRSYEHEVPFQKAITVGSIETYNNISVNVNCDYMNSRAITSRRVELHGVLSLKTKIFGTVSTDILTDIDCDGVQIKSGSCPATNPIGFAEKTVVIEEELELGRGGSAIRSVIRSDARAVIDESKIMGGKAVIKGDIIVNALYCTEEDTVGLYENSVPFHQMVDIDVQGDDCVCNADADIMDCSLKPRTNLSGEAKSFALECKLCFSVTASCENDIPVLYDAFGTQQNVELETATLNFKKLSERVNERHLCKKTLEFSENSFGTVIDLWCENKVGQVKVTDGTLSVGGTSTICLLCCDADGVPQYYERGVDFEYRKELDTDCGGMTADASIETVSSAYTILGNDRLEARIELSINAAVYSVRTKRVITGVNVTDSNDETKKRAPIMVYYAHSGEELWDIAKRYKACCCDIMSANGLDCEELDDNKMLIIP